MENVVKVGTKVKHCLFGGDTLAGVVISIELCDCGKKHGKPVSSMSMEGRDRRYVLAMNNGHWCYGDQVLSIVEQQECTTKKEKKQLYVWMVYLESNVDGEIMFEAVPCASLKRARKVLQEEKDWLLKESNHFGHYQPEDFKETFIVEEDKDRFFVHDPSDDYWEDYKIVKKKILEQDS